MYRYVGHCVLYHSVVSCPELLLFEVDIAKRCRLGLFGKQYLTRTFGINTGELYIRVYNSVHFFFVAENEIIMFEIIPGVGVLYTGYKLICDMQLMHCY